MLQLHAIHMHVEMIIFVYKNSMHMHTYRETHGLLAHIQKISRYVYIRIYTEMHTIYTIRRHSSEVYLGMSLIQNGSSYLMS